MIGPIKPFRSLGGAELVELQVAFERPLSGYLAGRSLGGHYIRELEDRWQKMFHVKHAVATNSATSGLLAAAFVVGLKPGDSFVCPAMTMSATCAAPMFTGATPYFADADELTFGIEDSDLPYDAPVFATNLFGHPASLTRLRRWCDLNKTYLIEDNAQSPFAMEHGKYAGTIGHIGVWSLNVHKHIQCGEGGIVTTDDDELAAKLRAFINHGEHVAENIGLNLRMTELTAAIAVVQLLRGVEIVNNRTQQAIDIIKAIGSETPIRMPVVRKGCSHVFYTIPFLMDDQRFAAIRRGAFCDYLRSQGVPIVEGYVEPLYRMKAFRKFERPCPVAEDLHDRRLFYIENCAYDFTPEQIEQIGEAFRKGAEMML